jgi:hypothetical protein
MGFGMSGLLCSRCSLDRREADEVWRTPRGMEGLAATSDCHAVGRPAMARAVSLVRVSRQSSGWLRVRVLAYRAASSAWNASLGCGGSQYFGIATIRHASRRLASRSSSR